MREREGRRQGDRYLMYTREELHVQGEKEREIGSSNLKMWFVVSLSIAKHSASGSIFVMQQPS